MTEYRRYQGRSYFVWSGEVKAEGYEYPMLFENRISGLLSLRAVNADEQMQFWYDISSMQSVEEWIGLKKTGSAFLKKVLTALAETIEQAGEFLLGEDGICLLPERIFVDAEEREISFCYVPFEKKHFPDALCGFMEYYLSHMEHEDRKDAQKCYDVYEKCRQKAVSMEEVLEILYEDTNGRYVCPDAISEDTAKPKEEKKQRADGVKNPAKGLLGFFEEKRIPAFSIGRKRKKYDREAYAYVPKEYQEEMKSPTVFLGSETKQVIGELKYEGEGSGTNLSLTDSVFLIGSRKGEVDGVICDETVSRIHARITKEEDGFYLEDMNSTNGTYRNGELLNYKEKVMLEKNDRVTFAKVVYRFV